MQSWQDLQNLYLTKENGGTVAHKANMTEQSSTLLIQKNKYEITNSCAKSLAGYIKNLRTQSVIFDI